MKKITMCIMAALLLLTIIPTQLKAESNPTAISAKTVESAEAKILLSRLDEINAMDKSKMSSPLKKQLRKEVRSIKSRLNSLDGGGIYLSVGALIVILILLIILL